MERRDGDGSSALDADSLTLRDRLLDELGTTTRWLMATLVTLNVALGVAWLQLEKKIILIVGVWAALPLIGAVAAVLIGVAQCGLGSLMLRDIIDELPGNLASSSPTGKALRWSMWFLGIISLASFVAGSVQLHCAISRAVGAIPVPRSAGVPASPCPPREVGG